MVARISGFKLNTRTPTPPQVQLGPNLVLAGQLHLYSNFDIMRLTPSVMGRMRFDIAKHFMPNPKVNEPKVENCSQKNTTSIWKRVSLFLLYHLKVEPCCNCRSRHIPWSLSDTRATGVLATRTHSSCLTKKPRSIFAT